MNTKLQNTCDQIVMNRKAIKKCMFWEIGSNTYAIMAALMTASKGMRADAVKYKECKKILRRNVSVFSEMRGIAGAIVTTKMTMVDDPETYVRGVQQVYRKLRKLHKLTASANMVIAAMNIYEHAGIEGADADIDKLEELYKSLQKQHPFLICDSDRAYLSLIAAAGLSIPATVEKIEANYEACKKLSIHKDAMHSLSQLLALSSVGPEANRNFVESFLQGLKENRVHFSKTYGLPAVGALALLNLPAEQLARDVAEASAYLKQHRGFRWYNTSYRSIYACLAVFMSYAENREDLAAGIGSGVTMAIVEAIILMLVIMVMMSSVHSSHSSSSST